MPSIRVKDNESPDMVVRRFKRVCEKAGVPARLRQLEYYEKPTEERKRKKAAARKRHLKKLMRENPLLQKDKPKKVKKERPRKNDDYMN